MRGGGGPDGAASWWLLVVSCGLWGCGVWWRGFGLFSFLGVEVAGGDLEGVEDESGAAVVDGLGGEADGDVGESGLDGLAVAGAAELELVAGNDGGRGTHAVLVAEVLVVHGVATRQRRFGLGQWCMHWCGMNGSLVLFRRRSWSWFPLPAPPGGV